LLFWPRARRVFEQHCVGSASAADLGYVRAIACSVLLVYTLSEDLPSYARIGPSFMHAPGYFHYLGEGAVTWWFASPLRLWCIWLLTLFALGLGALGLRTRLSLPLAALVYLLFAALLRAPGKAFHEGYLGWYVLVALCFMPAGDAFSLDSRLSR